MQPQKIEHLDDPRVAGFRNLRDGGAPAREGLFVVEGRDNLRRLLCASSFEVRAMLLTPTALEALRGALASAPSSAPVYVASSDTLSELAGFHIHRGCLALGSRGDATSLGELVAERPPLLLALEYVGNADNVGGLFRNAMAFGVGGVLLCPRTCDPLYRKATRVSMGGTLTVPFARATDWPNELRRLQSLGYEIVALHPGADAEPLAAGSNASAQRPLLLLVGNEGQGLSEQVLALADRRVCIPMADGVDSLNVATACGIALHHFSPLAASGIAR